ncbi:MAG: hypothetical protein GXO91_10315 [FCB group bacterium]|nr:hypothetical protein [FCB group bacterium]
MHRSRIIKKILLGALSWPVFLLGQLIPRRKDIWVFGAWFGNRYGDSPRYLFEYVIEHLPGIRAVWLTHDKKLVRRLRTENCRVYGINSLLGFWYCARAGAVFVNTGYADVNRYAVVGAFRIQCWHGIPLKKIHYDDEKNFYQPASRLLKIVQKLSFSVFPFLKEESDLIISTSPAMTQRLLTAFRTSRQTISETGSPRTDVILQPKLLREQVLAGIPPDKKVILFAPTHRNLGAGQTDLFAEFPTALANKTLRETGAIFLIKMHYYHEQNQMLPEILQSAGGDIRLLKSDDSEDINLVLPFVDILITDYSSVFFDFLVLDRPIIFTPFDLADYLNDDRELYEAYESATPGPKCMDWEAVFQHLQAISRGEDNYKTERRSAINRWYSHLDTKACERIVGLTGTLLEQKHSGIH